METLRRGKKTDDVFDRAAHATSHFHSFEPGTARAVESVEPISVAEARRMFDEHRRAKMQRRDDGTYVFVVGTTIGYTRVEIEARGTHSGGAMVSKKTSAKGSALETVRRLMRSTGFDEEEVFGGEDNQLHFSSREEGDVLEGRADPGMVRFAREKVKEIEAAVPGARARAEVVDEWVSIQVILPTAGKKAATGATIKAGQVIEYKTITGPSSGRVVRVGKSTVDVAGPGPSRGLGTHGPIQLGGGGVMTILKSDVIRTKSSVAPEPQRRTETAPKARAYLKPGDEVKYTNFTIGGSYEGTAIVTWDHGKNVEARTLPAGEKIRLERASDGSLRRFT